MKPDPLFQFWTPDAVAECLGVSDDTYRALWHIVATQPPLIRALQIEGIDYRITEERINGDAWIRSLPPFGK